MKPTFIIFLIAFLTLSVKVYPQFFERESKPEDTLLNNILLRHEFSGGGMFHTMGWGGTIRKSYSVDYFTQRLFEFDLVGMRDVKQVRINPYGVVYSNARSYVYGKLNKFYLLRGGIGREKLLNEKPYWGGVEIRLHYSGGFDLGLAKPIYLYILELDQPLPPYGALPKKIERYDPDKHFREDIFGRASFFEGITETTLHPGVYIKAGLNFEFGTANVKTDAIEVGGVIDFLAVPAEIMARSGKRYYFATLYLSYTFGKRWNR